MCTPKCSEKFAVLCRNRISLSSAFWVAFSLENILGLHGVEETSSLIQVMYLSWYIRAQRQIYKCAMHIRTCINTYIVRLGLPRVEGLIDGLRLRCGEEIIILRGYAETMRRITLTLALRQDGNHIKLTNGSKRGML